MDAPARRADGRIFVCLKIGLLYDVDGLAHGDEALQFLRSQQKNVHRLPGYFAASRASSAGSIRSIMVPRPAFFANSYTRMATASSEAAVPLLFL